MRYGILEYMDGVLCNVVIDYRVSCISLLIIDFTYSYRPKQIEIGVSWFISLYTFYFITGILTTIATNILYPKANFMLLLIFWEIAFASIVLYVMTISALNKKATRATMIGILLFFSGYFLTLIADYTTGSSSTISLLSIHPMTAISYGLQIIGSLEETSAGLTADTLNFSDNPSGYTAGSAIGRYGRNIRLSFPFIDTFLLIV